jgi:hypothetical protein
MKVIHMESISTYESDIKERVKSAQERYEFFKNVNEYIEKEPIWLKYKGYQLLDDGLLTYKCQLYIPNCDELKRFIMDELHKIVAQLRGGGVNQLFPCLNNYGSFKLFVETLNDNHNNAGK